MCDFLIFNGIQEKCKFGTLRNFFVSSTDAFINKYPEFHAFRLGKLYPVLFLNRYGNIFAFSFMLAYSAINTNHLACICANIIILVIPLINVAKMKVIFPLLILYS